MEEDLIKYFTGQGNPTTETIEPINVKNGIVKNLDEKPFYHSIITSNDKNYIIRYGGNSMPNVTGYNAIEVYNNNAFEEGEPLYKFDNLKINNHSFTIRDMKQDENGRFYAIAYYYDTNMNETEYLIIFNNFIQDGECHIRKFYTATQMGMPSAGGQGLSKIIKTNGYGHYYMIASENKIYNFNIDIINGNSLKVYNYTDTTAIPEGGSRDDLQIINNNLILLRATLDNSNNICCKKLTIDIEKEPETTYSIKQVYSLSMSNKKYIINDVTNYKFYISYLTPISNSSNAILKIQIIDMNGTNTTLTAPDTYIYANTYRNSFSDNYITVTDGSNLDLLYYNDNQILRFKRTNFTGSFSHIQELKQFNLVTIVGLNSRTSIAYSKNIYSIGYSSEPYYNNNFMIPQYLNLYTKANDLTSLVYSRDVINRFVAGNQLTATFNIPNYLLNNQTIHREIVKGQTNLDVEDNNKPYSKNRFESLYMTYMYSLNVKDNTNEDNLINYEGSNRIANSVWQELDYQASPCLKARITYQNPNEDATSEIITLSTPTISGTTATYTFQVVGNVIKIEYLSNDENTVYATYRCKLTGTNTITQTIEVEEG